MRQPASTENEMLLRELNETEEALAEASLVLGCTCIIDPTETLGDRVRHLAMLAILMQANLGQLRARANQNLDPGTMNPSDILGRLGEN